MSLVETLNWDTPGQACVINDTILSTATSSSTNKGPIAVLTKSQCEYLGEYIILAPSLTKHLGAVTPVLKMAMHVF